LLENSLSHIILITLMAFLQKMMRCWLAGNFTHFCWLKNISTPAISLLA